MHKGEFDNAIDDYTEAIKRNPNDADAYYVRGTAYLAKGEFDNAIDDYTEAIKRKKDYAGAYYVRGTAYVAKGDVYNAISDYNTTIKYKPDFAGVYVVRGLVCLHLRKWKRAKSDLMKARNLGVDIGAAFHEDYASVEDFEQEMGIQLPEGIAALLTS